VLKDAQPCELLQAIRSVIAGQKYFSERCPLGWCQLFAATTPRRTPVPRSPSAEREVLTRIALGESNSVSPWRCV